MSQDEKAPEPTPRNLRDILARDLTQGERPLTFSTQRLQPTVVPPPPSAGYVSELPQFDVVSPDDDIEPDHAEELVIQRKRMMVAMACITLFGLVGLGYFALNRSTQPGSSVVIPEIKADLPAQAKVLPPPQEPTEQAASSPNDSSMGQVSTELVPPTTDGLSPARKISTTRIVVENDLEVQTLK